MGRRAALLAVLVCCIAATAPKEAAQNDVADRQVAARRYVFSRRPRQDKAPGATRPPVCDYQALARAIDAMHERLLRSLRQINSKMNALAGVSKATGAAEGRPTNRKRSLGAACPDGFEGVDGWLSCYKLSKFNATWHEARKYCAVFNADLLAVELEREHYLVTFIIQNTQELAQKNNLPKYWWTGGNYIVQSNNWMWASQQYLRPITWKGWPDSNAINTPDREKTHCIALDKDENYQWSMQNCDRQLGFICEVKIG